MSFPSKMLQRIELIFNEALSVPEGDRQKLIEARCQGDALLLVEVSTLLDACVAEEMLSAARLQETQAGPVKDAGRIRIGAYEIDRLIGRGGMGAVYLAHRADGNFEQQVAVKLIDLPLATDLFRERFRMERQILAGLSHPFIARLIDGGVTADGEPFLVMEYVDGVPINRFCDSHSLSLAQRLLLFKSVCEAVQFAHQNLVIHRDLKPDNILVSVEGMPRLLDFGTAKLLSPSRPDSESELTRLGFQSFTPQYASPEQVLGHAITTASDTYSLGVLLYLLLTGTLPYELKEFTTSEMIRVICEEPPRPMGKGLHLDPDLEAIVFKALRKEPSHRYLTAEQLAADVQAYHDGRPVSAVQGTFRYRAGKFIRRHKIALGAAAVVIVSLIAGVAGIVWQARIATAQRHRAEARAADLRELSSSLLSELDEAIKELPGSTGVQKLLVTRVLEHLDRASKDTEGDEQTQVDLVDAYVRLGNIQGNPYDQNLGDPKGALTTLDKAHRLATSMTSSLPEDRDAAHAMASVLQARSEVLWGMERTPEAVAAMQSAVHEYDRLLKGREVRPALIAEVASAYGTLADELGQPGTPSMSDFPAALAAYKRAIELHESALKLDSSFQRSQRGIAVIEMKIGNIEIETDPAQALQDYKLSEQEFDRLLDSSKDGISSLRMHANILRKQATAMRELAEFQEAAPLFDQALTIQKKISAQDPKDARSLFDVYVDLSQEAFDYEDAADPAFASNPADRLQKLAIAVPLLKEARDVVIRILKINPSNDDWKAMLADDMVRLGTDEQELGNSSSAAISATGLADLKELGSKHPDSNLILDHLIAALLMIKPATLRDAGIATKYAEHEAQLTKRRDPDVLLYLAEAYRAAGRVDLAQTTAKEGLALLPTAPVGPKAPRTRRLLQLQLSEKAAAP